MAVYTSSERITHPEPNHHRGHAAFETAACEKFLERNRDRRGDRVSDFLVVSVYSPAVDLEEAFQVIENEFARLMKEEDIDVFLCELTSLQQALDRLRDGGHSEHQHLWSVHVEHLLGFSPSHVLIVTQGEVLGTASVCHEEKRAELSFAIALNDDGAGAVAEYRTASSVAAANVFGIGIRADDQTAR